MAGYSEEWVDVQKLTFTRWANTYLSRKRMQIDDLYEDLQDGIRLISLLQIICREKVCRKFNRKPRMRIQKMENLNFALAFLQKKNVNVTNIGSSDILDGNNKLVLGLMWTIIKSFTVAEIDVEGVSGKDGLLLWVNRSLVDYPTVDVRNFSSSWSDGMAFCALIHRFYPSIIDFDKLNPANAHENVQLAFDLALEKFRIPKLLEVADVAGQAKPDEKSITTYVSLLFKEFASGQQKKKAVTTISKAVNIAQRHQDLADEYTKVASSLLEWMTYQAERFQTLSEPRRIPDIKNALTNHLEYKKNEKPPHEAEYVAVEGVAGRWIASCKNNNRDIPVLEPPIEKLQEMKAKLDARETEFELRLRDNLEGFQKTEIFLTKVVKELEKVEAWAKDKESSPLFEEGLLATSTTDAEEKLESISFIQEIELPRYKLLLATVVDHAEGLSASHSETSSTLERVEAMKNFVATVENRFEDTKLRLEQALQAQLEVDAVVKDCKVLMRNLKYVIEEMDEEIEAATNLDDVSKSGIIAAKEQFEQVLVPKVQDAVVSENEKLIQKKDILLQAGRAADVALIEKCNARVDRLLESLEQKRGYFENEMDNVEKRDIVCKEFADLSARIKERCAQSTQSINTVEGTLADQFTSMVKLRHKLFRSNTGIVIEEPVAEEAPAQEGGEVVAQPSPDDILGPLSEDMEKLEAINEQLEQLRVYQNPYTTDTIHGLRAQFQSLENAVRDKVKSLEKEIALSKLGNLTPQQLKEIKEVFDHFDLDNDGVLARDEFIMACKGLGLSLSEDECHDYFDKIDEDDNDEISFDEFSGFCADQLQSGSTKDDVLIAFDVLTPENLTLEKIEEQFDPVVINFAKKNLDKLLKEDGVTLDHEKFTALVFSL
ncbi:Alpha-actinin-1, partial [Globisporangium splendens]